LSDKRHRPRRPPRSWGQNFLADPTVCERIIEAFSPAPDDRVIEVGPGRGALTHLLVGRVGSLTLVEIDSGLAAAVRQQHEGTPGMDVITGDILSVGLPELARRAGLPPGRKFRVIGNLPYSIATVLVRRFLDSRPLVSDALVMVQREVASRLLAPPGGRDYGFISVLVALRANARRVLEVRPGAFRPPPKVRSTLVALDLSGEDAVPPRLLDPLQRLLSTAFGQRRKTLANSLRGLPSSRPLTNEQLRSVLAHVDLPGMIRPEKVRPEQFLNLVRALLEESSVLI
jgi:16S rRNA (adenine1518-N6/adenine1519-N6)-dimethyltransferase